MNSQAQSTVRGRWHVNYEPLQWSSELCLWDRLKLASKCFSTAENADGFASHPG